MSVAWQEVNLLGQFDATQSVVDAKIELAQELIAIWGHNAHFTTASQMDTGVRLLACHLMTLTEPEITSESAGGLSVAFARQVGTGLESSSWGQLYGALIQAPSAKSGFFVV